MEHNLGYNHDSPMHIATPPVQQTGMCDQMLMATPQVLQTVTEQHKVMQQQLRMTRHQARKPVMHEQMSMASPQAKQTTTNVHKQMELVRRNQMGQWNSPFCFVKYGGVMSPQTTTSPQTITSTQVNALYPLQFTIPVIARQLSTKSSPNMMESSSSVSPKNSRMVSPVRSEDTHSSGTPQSVSDQMSPAPSVNIMSPMLTNGLQGGFMYSPGFVNSSAQVPAVSGTPFQRFARTGVYSPGSAKDIPVVFQL